MFKYARKNINKWLNNNIQLHFIMKHFSMTQRCVLCPHIIYLKLQLLPATSASCPVTKLKTCRRAVVMAPYPQLQVDRRACDRASQHDIVSHRIYSLCRLTHDIHKCNTIRQDYHADVHLRKP